MQRLADDGGRETVLARVWRPFKVVLFSNLLNILLLFFPFAIWQWKAGSDSLAFVFSLASLLSLAERCARTQHGYTLHLPSRARLAATSSLRPPQEPGALALRRVSFLVEQMEHHTGPTVALLLK